MTATAVGAPAASVRSRPALAWGLAAAGAALLAAALLSIAVGSKSIPIGTVFDALLHYDSRIDDHVVVRDLRVPRTLLGLVVGAALGLAGAIIQALTRNPLADPGILGINEGAGLGVLVAIGIVGLTSPWAYVWFAFAGAAASAVIVYAIGARGREGASPVRLVLAGIAFTYVLHAIGRVILLRDSATFDRWRNWMVGSLASADPGVIVGVLPFVALGAAIALGLTPSLNALALGEEAGQALGVHRGQTRVLGAVAVTLLCGAATAAAGPIAFVGLMVPYAARMITGPDYRWLVPYSLVLAPILLLVSDVFGRVVTRPSEVGVGVVTAVIGAPLLIVLVRRRGKLPRL